MNDEGRRDEIMNNKAKRKHETTRYQRNHLFSLHGLTCKAERPTTLLSLFNESKFSFP